jgi:hypothetical protein
MWSAAACREQGFVNGLALQPNAYVTAALPPLDQRELLGRLTDAALVSLAGNLRSFELEDHTGRVVAGAFSSTQGLGLATLLNVGFQGGLLGSRPPSQSAVADPAAALAAARARTLPPRDSGVPGTMAAWAARDDAAGRETRNNSLA